MPQHDILFTLDFPPIGGGIARMMAELARWYPDEGLLVSTGAMPGSEQSDADFSGRIERIGVPAVRLKTLQGRFFWTRQGLALARHREARFAWCSSMRPAGYPARAAWRRHRLPYGICFYGGDLLFLDGKIAGSNRARRTAIWLLSSATVLVAISKWTAERLRELLHRLDLDALVARIVIIPLGTDPDTFQPDHAAAESFRIDHGLPPGQWLVTVARLVPHKGVDIGLETLARLAPTYPNLHYAVVGRGPYGEALRSQVSNLGIGERVHFLEDVTDDHLPAVHSMADVYLGLSQRQGRQVEGFGISLLEAAASGVPAVAAASGGIPDAVVDGETGLLVPPGDVDATASALSQLLDDPARAQLLGEQGRERVIRAFTWQRVAADFERLAGVHGRR